MADAKKAAVEVALSMQPHQQESILKEQDAKYKRIAPLAIQRIQFLLEDKAHVLNQAKESGKEVRKQAREHKQALFTDLTKHSSTTGHQWESKGRSVMCQQCKKRLTMYNTAADLQAGKTEECPLPKVIPMVGGADEALQANDSKAAF